MDRAAVEHVLSAAPLRRERGGDDTAFTFYSVVMELSATPALHLTDGPPGDGHFHTVNFREVGRR